MKNWIEILALVLRILSLITLTLGVLKSRDKSKGAYRENMYLLSIIFINLSNIILN